MKLLVFIKDSQTNVKDGYTVIFDRTMRQF